MVLGRNYKKKIKLSLKQQYNRCNLYIVDMHNAYCICNLLIDVNRDAGTVDIDKDRMVYKENCKYLQKCAFT